MSHRSSQNRERESPMGGREGGSTRPILPASLFKSHNEVQAIESVNSSDRARVIGEEAIRLNKHRAHSSATRAMTQNSH